MKPEGIDSSLIRSAPADLWHRTLTRIPSVFGRLVYLSSLRSPSGAYEHFGFTQAWGYGTAQAALLQSHEQTFATWLGYILEEQKADLDLYLTDLIGERESIVETWLRLAPYRNLVPVTARESERRLFLTDFDTLLEILRREYKLGRPDPER